MAHFKGSDVFYPVIAQNEFFITEGCYYLREHWKLGWLFDVIGCGQHKVANHSFQVWEFSSKDGFCLIKCTDGNNNLLFAQEIENSDLPLPSILLWVVDMVCMLPSEY